MTVICYCYPFGLTMAGISSKAFGGVENHKQYNGIEHTTDLEMNQYDAFYRTLDPQVGRFLQIDPKIESADGWSPYSAMLDNPIRYADPLGDSTIPGGGFWKNIWEGVKDGAKETGTFIKSLGTTKGWKSLGSDIANSLTSTSTYDVATGTKIFEIATQKTAFSPENAGTEPVTKDNIGHAIGYGLEKTAEGVVISKGAGIVGNALKGSEVLTTASSTIKVTEAAKSAVGWLGKEFKTITNKAGDKIFMSQDGLRKMRFDINSSQGDKPHVHLEVFKNGKWTDATDVHRIYPKQ